MRIVSAIDRPLADEHVIGVDPPLRPDQPGVWRRRINPFTGRSLSDRALTAEQDARSGIQRLRGQGVTAGIVSGLDLLLEPGALGAALDMARLQLLPGIGLAQSGEDIVVSSPRSIALADLPVRARADILDAIAANEPPPGPVSPAGNADPDAQPGGAFSGLYPLLPRRIAKTPLGAMTGFAAASALPRVAVLVAQPVTATILANARDDCAPDPRDDPYDDLQLIDGVRLMLDFWPSEMVARGGGPDYSLPAPAPVLRNRLAYRIFNVERAMLPGEIHPWEATGVPLALIGFNPDWTLAFIDRASVVRLGGRPNPRTPLVPQSGNPVLWQARIAQFAEHLAGLPDLSPATLATALRQLPPVGFLPIDVVDLVTRRQSFFPAGFGLSLAPMPIEQIDLIVAESAALVPINLDVIDEIELLIPVPERVYEPGLLEIASVDAAFRQAIIRAVADRSRWLVRRELVRRRRDVLFDGTTGQRRSWSTGGTGAREVLPDPAGRGPIGCTRVREVAIPTNGGGRIIGMGNAGSTLTFDQGDTAYAWVKVVDPNGLKGFSLSFGIGTKGLSGDYSHTVFWGDAAGLPAITGNPPIGRQGDMPTAGAWQRLEVSADAVWSANGQTLAGVKADGLMTGQINGTLQWGPIGKIDAAGNETVWIGDDAPPGATLFDTFSQIAGWPFVPAGINAAAIPPESDFGTVENGGVRSAGPVMSFRSRWTQPFLAADLKDLDDAGIDGFVRQVEARLKATNDAIDLGFVRARADIYRVRQFMLGADAASRLVTSPALADLATREESARAKSLDIAAYLKTAYQSDFNRDPDSPLSILPKRTASQPAPAPAAAGNMPTAVLLAQPNFNLLNVAARNAVLGNSTPVAATRMAPGFQPRATPIGGASVFVNVPTATPVGTATAFSTIPAVQTFQLSDTFMSLAGARAEFANRRGFNIGDIQGQTPLPSAVERTASVAERLVPAPAVEAHGYAIAGKLAVLTAIAGLIGKFDPKDPATSRPDGIALADLPAPGYNFRAAAGPEEPRLRNTIGDVIPDLKKEPSAREYNDLDQVPTSGQGAARHEADYFTASVKAIDNTIALMRLVESRVDLYGKLIADAKAVREELIGHIGDADARLRSIGVEIEEARQDVAVATALIAEEEARVDALNARRKAILEANANMVLFRRPRRARRTRAVATAPATAALEPSPILACAREHPAVPEEIHSYVGLMRDAPVAWFPNVHPHLERIDRLEAVRAALASVQQRAATPPIVYYGMQVGSTASRFLKAVGNAMVAQRNVMEERRLFAQQLNLAAIQAANLANARRVLLENAAMADMIAADHNRAILAKAAAQEIEHIGDAAACLHDSFGETPAVNRLQWAETLSEYDRPAPLDDLNGLIGWSEMPVELRRTQQTLVHWLFSRIDKNIPAAVTAINELVRICLLMAAHAPVDRLIPVRLVQPAPVRIGGRMSVYADAATARVGMTALVSDQSGSVIAHAVIEDINDGIAHSRIVTRFGDVATLTTAMRFHLSDVRLAL